MDEQFIIEPTFRDIGSGQILEFTVGAINALADTEFNSHVGFYQQQMGIYSYMRMTHYGDYIIHYPKGNPLLLQPHNSCAWTPQGQFNFGQKTISGSRAKINVEDCYDEYFGSTFERFLEWGGNPNASMNAAGVQAMNMMARHVAEQATLGTRAALTGGGLFSGTEAFLEGTPRHIIDAFIRTVGTSRGWIQYARALASDNADKYGHMNNNLIGTNVSADGLTYTGDVLALFDSRVNAAPRKLSRAIKRGGRGGFGGTNMPVWLVSSSVADAVYKAYLDQSTAVATNRPRITTQEFQVANGRGGTSPLLVYYIDRVAVVPVEEVEVFADYLTGTPHFDYLTLTGVIQLGGNFGSIPEIGSNNVAIRVQRSDRNEDLGKITYLSHMLLATAFNDTDYIAGGYTFAVPA